MKVCCKISSLSKLKSESLISFELYKKYFNYDLDYEFLDVQINYFAYGILISTDGIWILVASADDDYPIMYPIIFFQIIDPVIPNSWIFGNNTNFNLKDRPTLGLFSFKEFIMEERFYEKLIDGDSQCQKIFNKYKQHILFSVLLLSTIGI